MTVYRVFALASIFAVPVLAGCLTGPASPGFDSAVVIGPTCDPEVVANCEAARRDPDTPWIVEDLTLRGGPEASVGLMVLEPSRDLLIRDVRITGFTVAIRVGVPLGEASCPDCTIRVKNATLHAAPPESTPGLTAIGIGTNADLEAVVLRNVSIETAAGKQSTLFDGEGGAVSRSTGVSLDTDLTRFAFNDLSVTERTDHGGEGVSASVQESWVGRGLRVRGGYQRAVDAFGSRISLSDVDIECGYRGLDAGASRIEISDLRVHGCREAGIVAQGGYVRTDPDDGTFLQDVEVSNSSTGVDIPSGYVNMTGFELHGNEVGVALRRDGPPTPAGAYLGDGAVTNSSAAGVTTLRRDVIVRDVAFRDNGWERYEDGAALRVELSLPSERDDIVVQGSSFEDNLFGIRSPATVDARHNWWGSDRGPRVWAGPGRPPDATGEGDPVSPTVVFTPHR